MIELHIAGNSSISPKIIAALDAPNPSLRIEVPSTTNIREVLENLAPDLPKSVFDQVVRLFEQQIAISGSEFAANQSVTVIGQLP